MLGLLLIYFIGKRFYELAAEFKKHQWGIAIAGVASYYAGTIMAGILFALYHEIWGTTSIDETSDVILNLFSIPFGLISCVGLYYIFKKTWKSEPLKYNPEILDQEIPD